MPLAVVASRFLLLSPPVSVAAWAETTGRRWAIHHLRSSRPRRQQQHGHEPRQFSGASPRGIGSPLYSRHMPWARAQATQKKPAAARTDPADDSGDRARQNPGADVSRTRKPTGSCHQGAKKLAPAVKVKHRTEPERLRDRDGVV
jgi:hypothetical protein